MIICHDRRLIFVKTRKVGGTSFEIALSQFCGPRDVITPLTFEDEALRAALGGQGARNFRHPRWPGRPWRSRAVFRNHISAAQIRARVPAALWRGYRKVAIMRNPWEVAASRYYWRVAQGETADFTTFLTRRPARLASNARIAPLSGPDALDLHLRHDRLADDMAVAGLSEVYARMRHIRAKSDARPAQGGDTETLFRQHPEAVALIARHCAEEIAHFNWRAPV